MSNTIVTTGNITITNSADELMTLIRNPNLPKSVRVFESKGNIFDELIFFQIGDKIFAPAVYTARKFGFQKPENAIPKYCKNVIHLDYTQEKEFLEKFKENLNTLNQGVYQILDHLLNPRGLGILPERDIWEFATKSNLPEKEELNNWIFGEVMPSLRKTGAYSINPYSMIPNFDNPIEAAEAWIVEKKKNLALETELNDTKKELKVTSEKKEILQDICQQNPIDLKEYSLDKVALYLNLTDPKTKRKIGRNKFYKLLRDQGILESKKDNWNLLSGDWVFMGYGVNRDRSSESGSHAKTSDVYLFQKGVTHLREILINLKYSVKGINFDDLDKL